MSLLINQFIKIILHVQLFMYCALMQNLCHVWKVDCGRKEKHIGHQGIGKVPLVYPVEASA